MPDTILTWSITNLITIAVMMIVASMALVLIAQGFHMAANTQ